jgi:RNA polymerase sigma-70 factor (ECF subfamily)
VIVETEFVGRANPYRRELQVHCYRLLGNVADAEDALQETLLRAWRSADALADPGALRGWLYRIATNVCLRMIERRRPIESLDARLEHLSPEPDPEARTIADEQLSLALLASLQLLPSRQRAALLLCEVLDHSAAEAASILDTSVAAVNSALQRARATLANADARGRLLADHAPESAAAERDLLERFLAAWRNGDVDRLVRLFADDAILTMPPHPLWITGRPALHQFFATVPASGAIATIPLVETRANGQPALAAYVPDHTGTPRPYGMMVLAIRGHQIATIIGFTDPAIFPLFALPTTIT